MEQELKSQLKSLFDRYAKATGKSLATISQLFADDWRFCDRLSDKSKTITLRKYDDIVIRFSTHWPEACEWPINIKRLPANHETSQ